LWLALFAAVRLAAGETPPSQKPDLSIVNGLIAWWKLDETGGTIAADAAGNGYAGTLQNSATWKTDGKFGGALQLKAPNDMFLCSVKPVPLGAEWTICAWFTAPLPATETWHTLTRSQNNDHHVILDASLNLGMFDNVSGGSFRDCGFNLGGLSAGWHHLAAVGSGATTAFYIDGRPVGSSDRKAAASDVFAVGNYQGGDQRFADAIDDVRIYNRAVTAAELARLAGSDGKPLPPAPLAAPAHHRLSFKTTWESDFTIQYVLYLPKGYDQDPPGTVRPMLVYLEGVGERGSYEGVYGNGPDGHLRNNPALRDDYPFIGLSPVCPGDRRWDTPGMMRTVAKLMDHVMKNWRVDPTRVYATGLSMGGLGTWLLADEAVDRLAVIAPIDAVANRPETALERYKDLAIWIINGEADGHFTAGGVTMAKALKESKNEVALTLIPGGGHGSWHRYYGNPDFFKWLLKHSRPELAAKAKERLAKMSVLKPVVSQKSAVAPPLVRPNPVEPPIGADGTGCVLREWWVNIGGENLAAMTSLDDFPDYPAGAVWATTFEAPRDWADNYGTLMRGYVHPPTTGKYVFFIASDDNSELWLSADDKPANKKKIAFVPGCTGPQEWGRFGEQKSPPMDLTAGKKYYIEALQKEGGGGDHLAVAWQLPEGHLEAPIPGNRISPFRPPPPGPKLPKPPPATPGHHHLQLATRWEKDFELPYMIYLPKGYNEDSPGTLRPMLVFLQGDGERGNFDGIFRYGPDKNLRENPTLQDQYPFIGLSPVCPGEKPWGSLAPDDPRFDSPIMAKIVAKLLDHVTEKFRVDPTRVYATGISMGGTGVWYLADAAADRLAAIAPMSGRELHPETALERYKDLNIWIVTGERDGDFSAGAVKMAKALKDSKKEVAFTMVPGADHFCFNQYYADPKFYEWLLKHSRPELKFPKKDPVEAKENETIRSSGSFGAVDGNVAKQWTFAFTLGNDEAALLLLGLGVTAVVLALVLLKKNVWESVL
jgi:predicted peptidase